MKASDVMVTCVAENRPNWYRMVENLAISLRNFGGTLAGAPMTAYFVEGLDEPSAKVLRELGVDLKVVERYDLKHKTTNKLRMFQDFGANPTAEYLVALDCDTVVVGDFSAELTPVFRAMPPGKDPLTSEQWDELTESLGLKRATTPIVTYTQRQDQIPFPYFNSGVVLVPAQYAGGFADAWTKYTDLFCRLTEEGVDKPWTGYYLDQFSMACALSDQDIPVERLGPHVNLPTRAKLAHRVPETGDTGVRLLHYHSNISPEGFLGPSDSPAVNRVIDQVNSVVSARALRPMPTPPARSPIDQARRVAGKVKRAVRS